MKIPGAIALLLTISLLGCGGGSSRQLLSLTIAPASATAQSGQAQFTATGQFNQAPMNVTPAMAAWFQSSPPFDPPGDPISFTLSSQPFTAKCIISGQTMNVIAFAPVDASASNETIPLQVFLDLTVRHTTNQEGGFVAATAQLTCP